MTSRNRDASFAQSIYAALRQQPWLYDRGHDSMYRPYRHVAHVALRCASRVARLRQRLRGHSIPAGARLHLGSGRVPLTGWVNVDLNPFSSAQLWLDLRDRWPVRSDSISAIYSRHCFEHFSEHDLIDIIRQCARVLQPGGVIRIGVPSLELAVRQYLKRDFSFADWVKQGEPAAKQFVAYITDKGNHPIMLDFEYLDRLLSDAGFTEIRQRSGGDTAVLAPSLLAPKDQSDDWATLYVEATKPADATRAA